MSNGILIQALDCIFPHLSGESERDTVGRGMAPALQIGRMEVPLQLDAKYNEYYDSVRTPANLSIPGCMFVRRYHAVEGGPKYLTMYEFEHEKVPETLAWEAQRSRDTMSQYIGGAYGHAPGSQAFTVGYSRLGLSKPVQIRFSNGRWNVVLKSVA